MNSTSMTKSEKAILIYIFVIDRFAYICKITESKIIEKQVCVDVKYGKDDEKRVV